MEGVRIVWLLLVFVVMVSKVKENIANFDRVWQKHAEEAKKAARGVYRPRESC